MRKLSSVIGIVAALVVVLLPASAFGAVTIGSNLDAGPTNSQPVDYPYPTTESQRGLIATHREPAGLTAPSNGVIVRFAVKTLFGGPIALQVIRPGGNALTSTGAGTSAVAYPTGLATSDDTLAKVTSFGLNPGMAVRADDGIGLTGLGGDIGAYYANAPNVGEINDWNPPLENGGPPRGPFTFGGAELLLQATIEPDADGDRLGDETQDPDGGHPAPPPAGAPRCKLLNLNLLHIRVGDLCL